MVNKIRELLGPRQKTILLGAGAALPKEQFESFKRLLLNELGESGFIGDLKQMLEKERQETGRQIQSKGRDVL